jgi:hypothetical protein
MVAVLVAAMWAGGVTSPTAAHADTVPPAGLPATVSADPLPTVQVNGVVWSQVTVGTTVYATGSFTSARPAGSPAGKNETPRANLIAYNITTGDMISSFNHSLNAEGLVVTASPDGSRIYVGGSFTAVDGQPRYRLAAFDTATGALISSFHPTMDAPVRALAVTNSTVYEGGDFSNVNGVTRAKLAAVSASDGSVLSWNASANYTVNALILTPDGSKLVIGGEFWVIDGATEYGFGAVSAATGGLVPWASNGGQYPIRDYGGGAGISSFSTDGTNIYATAWVWSGGNLESRWAFNPADGSIIWVNDCSGDNYDSFPMNGVLYSVSHSHDCLAMGLWPQFGSDPYHHALAENLVSSGIKNVGPDPKGWNWSAYTHTTQLDWYPVLGVGSYTGQDQAAWSITGNGNYLALGGEFPTANNVGQQGLVRYAVKALAPNKVGPEYQPTSLNPTVKSSGTTVTVSWTADWDQDNQNLTYKVKRDGVQIATVASPSTFWQLPALSYTDTNVPPGVHTYRIVATDPFGNTMGDITDATVTTGGPIHTANGLCADVISAGSYGDIATCSSSSATQAWTVLANGLLQEAGTNYCLYANGWSAGASPYDGGCDANNSLEQWQYVASSKALLNKGAGLCLSTVGTSATSGTRMTLAVCDGSAAQQWTLPGAATLMANNPAALTGLSGLCLDTISPASYTDVASCSGTQSQKWIVRQDGLIQQAGQNWCLYANSWSVGGNPSVAGCDPNNSLMQWQWVASAKALLNKGAGLCLSGAAPSGTRTTLATCDGSAAQQWVLPGAATMTANSPAALTGVQGLCLDTISPASYTDVATCSGTQSQKWIVRQDGLIQQAGQNWCLYANGSSAGANPSVAGCDPNNVLMQWQYNSTTKGLLNVGSGLYLSTLNGGQASGTRTSIQVGDGSALQQWMLPGR